MARASAACSALSSNMARPSAFCAFSMNAVRRFECCTSEDKDMHDHPSVLIIGAGLGGIATAGLLARNGYEVTVLEKNATPGGRCGQIVRDGHRFDTGATLFLM